MFERTSILGGFRLVCPYHTEKKQDSQKSWVVILSSVGVLASASYLIYRNFDKFHSSSKWDMNDRACQDPEWTVEFTNDLGVLNSLRNEHDLRGACAGQINLRDGFLQEQRRRVQRVSVVRSDREPRLGSPIDSQPTGATAPPFTPITEPQVTPVEPYREPLATHRSTVSDYSVISVDRDPATQDLTEGYLGVDSRGVNNVWAGSLWGHLR